MSDSPTNPNLGAGTDVPEDGSATGLPDAELTRERRPHPATPLIRGWILLLAFAVAFGREFIPDGTNNGDWTRDVPWGIFVAIIAGVIVLAAVGAFVTWWFTRYVIDETELRIETGMLTKRSRRIGFNRIQSVDLIQPLAARLFSLAELRIEAGSGDGAKIRYLRRKDAARLRDYLLARAHGDTDAQVGTASTSTAFDDRSRTDRVIVTLQPQQLIGALLLSSEFITPFIIVGGVIVAGVIFDFWVYTLAGLFPLAAGIAGLVSRRVINQFNFSLADTGRGLRITRGLTNLTSQSLPVNRIQGVRVKQPLLWRRFGWYRLDVDVLGYGQNDETSNKSDASSMLLPVGTRDQVRAALAGCLPGLDWSTLDWSGPESSTQPGESAELNAVPLTAIPRRARWLRWWDHWTIGYGIDSRLAVNRMGWLTRVAEIVPHAKTQSARIEQGPLQRRLDLATIHIDTTPGPVNWSVPQVDAAQAREFVLQQMERARTARAPERSAADERSMLSETSEPTTEVRDGTAEQAVREE